MVTQIAAEEEPFYPDVVLQIFQRVTAWLEHMDDLYNEIRFRPFFDVPACSIQGTCSQSPT